MILNDKEETLILAKYIKNYSLEVDSNYCDCDKYCITICYANGNIVSRQRLAYADINDAVADVLRINNILIKIEEIEDDTK